MKISDYKKAIEIIFKNEFNQKEICLKLAQERPDLFCRLSVNNSNLVQKVIQLGKQGLKIQAIKEYRFETNASLQEAKTACEKIWKENQITVHSSF